MTAETTRPPLAERALARARQRRSAVGDPPLLRHPRDDGRRHQPRGGGARLRHAGADRRGRRPVPPQRPDPLHLELRHGRAAGGARRAPRTALRRPLRPRDGAADHGRGVGGGRSRAAGDVRPWRRGDPPRAVVCRVRPGCRVRRRQCPPRRDAPRGRLRPRPGRRRGGDHATDEGAVPRLSVQPDRRRPAGRRPGRAGPHRRAPRPARLQRRDLRPPRLRDVPPSGLQRPAGDARAHDPHGRLLKGLRDDRLAGRVPGGAGRDPRGDRQGPPVRDHVGSDDRAGCRAGSAPPRRRGCRADARSNTTDGGDSSSTGSMRSASGRSSRAARFTHSRR